MRLLLKVLKPVPLPKVSILVLNTKCPNGYVVIDDAETSHRPCHCCTAAEPSEAEFSAAKGEALQGLQNVIESINEVLEEIKYAEAEYNE